uniref:Nucleoside permease n=1 Tax=Candidatus Aschnera chinzeii TaxID=1485666 RepID=A0AAT9G3R2_9ENTR|nr:MAG: NupC/NupG family nucleoside CNT transporter [Candidatus Aschnera chinzeii]
MQLIVSIIGIILLILIAVIFSTNRTAIKLRTVIGAFMMQFFIGAFVLYIPIGRTILEYISILTSNIIRYGQVGINFIFGGLVSNKMFELFNGNGFIFALRVLPIIIFFSSLIAVCYYLGIMQLFIKVFGGCLQKILGTSCTESLSATANIFFGHTEAPLVVKPYISTMTKSELFAVMCGGLSSVAGSVLAGYAQMGISMKFLVAASFMAAPGGLLFAKLIVPETEKNNRTFLLKYNEISNFNDQKPANIIDAAASGASSGMQLALNVGAMLLAFVSLIALINGVLNMIGMWIHIPNLSLELILGWFFSPIAYIIGVPWHEANIAGSFIGQKLIINEFVAYMNFAEYLKSDIDVIESGKQVLSYNTKVIISFALCGFANLASVAILLGGIGGIAPNRREDIAKLGLKAVLAGTLSNLMSAAIASLFLTLSKLI